MILIQGYLLDESRAIHIDTRPIVGAYMHPQAVRTLWQGFAVQEFPGAAGIAPEMGSALMPATSVATLSGFTVADGSSALTRPLNSRVPQAWPAGLKTAQGGPSINFVRLGSRMRLIVRADRDFATQLVKTDAPSNTAAGWDFTTQELVPVSGGNQLPVSVVAARKDGAIVIGRDEENGNLIWEQDAAVAIILL